MKIITPPLEKQMNLSKNELQKKNYRGIDVYKQPDWEERFQSGSESESESEPTRKLSQKDLIALINQYLDFPGEKFVKDKFFRE